MKVLLYITLAFLAFPVAAEDFSEPVEEALLSQEMDPIDVPPAPATEAKPEAPVVGTPTKASAMRDVKLAGEAKDFPGLVRALDKLLPFLKVANQDRLLQKVEGALLKVTDPTMLELLRSQVTDDRVKQRLASRQLASATVVQEVPTAPVGRYARLQLDPYYSLSPFTLRDNRAAGTLKFESPEQFGLDIGGAFRLGRSMELGWRGGYHSLRLSAPAGKTISTTSLALYGGELDLGWYATASRSLRFSLGGSFESLPFVLLPDATNLVLIGAFVPAAVFRMNYEMAFSEGFSLGWQAYAEYLIAALTTQVRSVTGYGAGGDLTANIGLTQELWLTLALRGHYQNLKTSATEMTRYWVGGGLGILVRFR